MEEDHVDRVRAQWRTVRPDIDTSPIAIVARVGRAAAYFDQAINELMARHGLSRSSWDVLASLRRTGPPYELSPTELYRGLMRTSGAMTNRLHGLERSGLIERAPDPGDGRGMLVRLTPRGRELVDEIAPQHMETERRLLEHLTADEREHLETGMRRLLGNLEQASAGPPRETGKRHVRRGR
jgi:DNA-binding MarR family transcriptional regulator